MAGNISNSDFTHMLNLWGDYLLGSDVENGDAVSYKKGKLISGVTRGNGIIGEVVTKNVKEFKNDIYNDGAIKIEGGETSISGGIIGKIKFIGRIRTG